MALIWRMLLPAPFVESVIQIRSRLPAMGGTPMVLFSRLLKLQLNQNSCPQSAFAGVDCWRSPDGDVPAVGICTMQSICRFRIGNTARVFLLAIIACLLGHASASEAQPITSATISGQQVAPDSYTYSINLSVDPSSPDSAYSFWFAWIPLYDLLPSNPTAIGSPAGWTGTNAPDVYGVASVLWTTNSDPINAGQTLSDFRFNTPDPPSVIFGISDYLNLPVVESYVYKYPDARGDFDDIIPTVVVPEPTGLLVLLGVPVLLRRRRS
jgi:hypothetical protein